MEEKRWLNKVVIFAHKQYSSCLMNLRLSLCSLVYFNDVFNFPGLADINYLAPYEGLRCFVF